MEKVNTDAVPACGCVWRQECLFALSVFLTVQHETCWASYFFFSKLWDLFWNKKPHESTDWMSFDAVPLHQTLMDRRTGGWMDKWMDRLMDRWANIWLTDWRWLKSESTFALNFALRSSSLKEEQQRNSVSGCSLHVSLHLEAFLSCFELLLPSVTPRPLTLFLCFALSVFIWQKLCRFFPKSCY